MKFYLERDEDLTGISGTGRVAEGYIFEDGTVALRWLTEHRSTAIYASIAEVEIIHGHDGKTKIVDADGRVHERSALFDPIPPDAQRCDHAAWRCERPIGHLGGHYGATDGEPWRWRVAP